MTSIAHAHTAISIAEEQLDAALARRKHQDNFDSYPDAWRALIVPLEQRQKLLRAAQTLGREWSDRTFTAGSPVAPSVWNQLCTGKYPLPKTASARTAMIGRLQALTQAVAEIDLRVTDAALRSTRAAAQSVFVRDVNVDAILAAITKCSTRAGEGSEERLIVLRAATGEGKSTLRKWLAAEGHVHYAVSARPAWKSSYTAFLRALATVLSLDVASLRSTALIEAEILDKASGINGVIWFEEVQRLSVQAQELIKLLLNDTTLTVIISLTPEAYTAMRHASGSDFAQLFRRAACNMELAHADVDFLRAAAPDLWRKPHDPSGCDLILTAARKFGGRALIADVCRRLTLLTAGVNAIALTHIEAALTAYRAIVPDHTAVRRAFGQKVA